MAKTPQEKLDHTKANIKRWQSKLRRAMSTLDKLDRQRKRLERQVKDKPTPEGKWAELPKLNELGTKIDTSIPTKIDTMIPVTIDTSIPEFLKRGAAAQKAVDAIVADQIKAEQEATKKAKARGRQERAKAKKTGATKKMPLSGKAALDFIDQG